MPRPDNRAGVFAFAALGEAMPSEFLNVAAHWADRKQVPFVAIQDTDGVWCARLEFKDSQGVFYATVQPFNHRVGGKLRKGESDEEYADHVGRVLDRACVSARKARGVLNEQPKYPRRERLKGLFTRPGPYQVQAA